MGRGKRTVRRYCNASTKLKTEMPCLLLNVTNDNLQWTHDKHENELRRP